MKNFLLNLAFGMIIAIVVFIIGVISVFTRIAALDIENIHSIQINLTILSLPLLIISVGCAIYFSGKFLRNYYDNPE